MDKREQLTEIMEDAVKTTSQKHRTNLAYRVASAKGHLENIRAHGNAAENESIRNAARLIEKVLTNLEEENARLTNLVEIAEDRIRNLKLEAEALSRTGAVNALPERAPYEILQVLGREYETSGEMWTALRTALSALEPAASDEDLPYVCDACVKGDGGTCRCDPAPGGEPVTLTYKNWRGEVAERAIVPKRVWFGSTDWHHEPQWLLTALDVGKQADRDFALKDFGAAPEGQQEAVDWKRVDDALVSCAGLLKTLCRDEIGDTAAAELEYVRSAALKAAMEAGRHD